MQGFAVKARLHSTSLFLMFVPLFCHGANGQQHRVPFMLSKYNLPFVDVRLAGRPARALVDTGSFRSIQVSSTMATLLRLALHDTTQRFRRYDREGSIQQGTVPDLQIGQLARQNVTVDVIPDDIETIARQVGTPFDVILGWGLWREYYLTVDYSRQELRWSAKPLSLPLDDERAVRFTDDRGVPVIALPGDALGKALVDTGAPQSHLDKELAGTERRVRRMVPLGGQQVEVEFDAKDLQAIRQSLGCRAVLGTSFLRGYTVTFDPQQKIINFQKAEK